MATLKGVTLTLLMGPVAVAPAPVAVIEALESAQVTTAVGQRSGFQLVFTYSKTSPIATVLLPAGYFDPMIRVILVATLNGIPEVLADGPIIRQDVSASDKPGENRLTLTGDDISGYMDLIEWTGLPYMAMPAFARVAVMMAKYAMFGVIPLTIPPLFQSISIPTDKYSAQKGTDFQYATLLAAEAAHEFYIIPGPFPGTNTAYWGPTIRTGLPQPALTVDMDHAGNIDSLSFSADGNASELQISHYKQSGFSIPVPSLDISILKPPLAARPLAPTKIRRIAGERKKLPEILMSTLGGSGKADPVSASGSLDVTRYGRPMAARSLVGVRGGGLAHDGLWFVRSVTSTLGRGTWKQSFQLSREGLVSNMPVVPL